MSTSIVEQSCIFNTISQFDTENSSKDDLIVLWTKIMDIVDDQTRDKAEFLYRRYISAEIPTIDDIDFLNGKYLRLFRADIHQPSAFLNGLLVGGHIEYLLDNNYFSLNDETCKLIGKHCNLEHVRKLQNPKITRTQRKLIMEQICERGDISLITQFSILSRVLPSMQSIIKSKKLDVYLYFYQRLPIFTPKSMVDTAIKYKNVDVLRDMLSKQEVDPDMKFSSYLFIDISVVQTMVPILLEYEYLQCGHIEYDMLHFNPDAIALATHLGMKLHIKREMFYSVKQHISQLFDLGVSCQSIVLLCDWVNYPEIIDKYSKLGNLVCRCLDPLFVEKNITDVVIGYLCPC